MSLDLTKGSIPWQLTRMAGPMMIGIMSIMAMYFADSYFIAQLGVEPLAAVGFVLPMINVLSALGFSFGSAASSLVSRAIGSQDTVAIQRYATHALQIAFVHSLAFAVLGFFFSEYVFKLMGADDDIIDDILAYANVWLLGCFFVVVPMVGNYILRATGDTRLPGIVMLTIAVVNIGLDPILIFGWGPIPAFGVAGAALASVMAYSIACCVSLYVLGRRLHFLRWKYAGWIPWCSWRQVLHIAYPSVGTNLMLPLTVGVTTAFVAPFGVEAVAGLNIAMRLESFLMVPLLGFSSVMAAFMGQNAGAGNVVRMRRGLDWVSKALMAYGAAIYGLVLLFGHLLVSIFDTSAIVAGYSLDYLYLVSWAYGFSGLLISTNSCANALARPSIPLYLNILRLLGAYVPMLYILPMFLGMYGIFWALSLSHLIGGLASLWARRFIVP